MSNDRSIFSNIIWRAMERFGAQGVTLIVSIILARMIVPEVYGDIALVTVFTSILQVFVDGGLGNALIQKKDAEELDYDTVFCFNCIVCIFMYILLFFLSPVISDFFSKPELKNVIRLMGTVLIISGVKNVQQAYIAKNMMFKKFFFSTLIGTIGAAMIGIILAYKGYGIWALIVQNVFNQLLDTACLWITVAWRPRLAMSKERLKEMWKYGSKLLISELIDKIYQQTRQLVIGRKYSSESLAFYNRGNQLPSLIVSNINISIDSVLLPAMSNSQNDFVMIRSIIRRSIKMSTFILMPMMTGLAICADSIINILLTDSWKGCVIYLRIFCIIYAFYPVHTANLNAIKAIGKSDLSLKIEVLKKCLGCIILLITMRYGALYIALGLIAETFIAQLINSYPSKRLFNYSYVQQIQDLLPAILLSSVMGCFIWAITLLNITSSWLMLGLQIVIGVVIYWGGAAILHVESYEYLKILLAKYVNKRE